MNQIIAPNEWDIYLLSWLWGRYYFKKHNTWYELDKRVEWQPLLPFHMVHVRNNILREIAIATLL